jgi:hypothetical protein
MMRIVVWSFAAVLLAFATYPMAPAALASQAATKPTTLSGDAARKSEPGQSVVALFQAAHKGDRAEVRKRLLPDVLKDFDGDPNFVIAVLKDASDANVSELTIEMESATTATGRVTVRQGSNSVSTGMTIQKVDGVWKISL